MGLKCENAKASRLQHSRGVSIETLEDKESDEKVTLNQLLENGKNDEGSTLNEPMEDIVNHQGDNSSEHMELGGQSDQQSFGISFNCTLNLP
jgi:hypothetical protein